MVSSNHPSHSPFAALVEHIHDLAIVLVWDALAHNARLVPSPLTTHLHTCIGVLLKSSCLVEDDTMILHLPHSSLSTSHISGFITMHSSHLMNLPENGVISPGLLGVRLP